MFQSAWKKPRYFAQTNRDSRQPAEACGFLPDVSMNC